jgi:hypothetical protein
MPGRHNRDRASPGSAGCRADDRERRQLQFHDRLAGDNAQHKMRKAVDVSVSMRLMRLHQSAIGAERLIG